MSSKVISTQRIPTATVKLSSELYTYWDFPSHHGLNISSINNSMGSVNGGSMRNEATSFCPMGISNRRSSNRSGMRILRFIATMKLKETSASQLFRRLNSYSKQHLLYQA